MNYIQSLIEQNKVQANRLRNAEAQIVDFLTHLNSEKFKGTEMDGGRKDWIATGDVIHRLNGMRSSLEIDS